MQALMPGLAMVETVGVGRVQLLGLGLGGGRSQGVDLGGRLELPPLSPDKSSLLRARKSSASMQGGMGRNPALNSSMVSPRTPPTPRTLAIIPQLRRILELFRDSGGSSTVPRLRRILETAAPLLAGGAGVCLLALLLLLSCPWGLDTLRPLAPSSRIDPPRLAPLARARSASRHAYHENVVSSDWLNQSLILAIIHYTDIVLACGIKMFSRRSFIPQAEIQLLHPDVEKHKVSYFRLFRSTVSDYKKHIQIRRL